MGSETSAQGCYLHGRYSACLSLGRCLIKGFFGISIPAIRVAGGIIIMRVGFSMLNPNESDDITEEAKQESRTKKDIAFTPLAMPSLSGPGSISVVISMAAASDDILGYLAVSIGILARNVRRSIDLQVFRNYRT
ncbi:MAG: MarC family protein [Dysgonamonadaceae bacterium]|nr:MarC family protein [Dysgonamonadaceae bacterium]